MIRYTDAEDLAWLELCPGCVGELHAWLDTPAETQQRGAYKTPYRKPAVSTAAAAIEAPQDSRP